MARGNLFKAPTIEYVVDDVTRIHRRSSEEIKNGAEARIYHADYDVIARCFAEVLGKVDTGPGFCQKRTGNKDGNGQEIVVVRCWNRRDDSLARFQSGLVKRAGRGRRTIPNP